ncbi:DUF72 domain-containing protein [Quadrisphaera sp. DSM 44207]|uniref:DUF72 domain-containing protein n=1 Tax=Quadrisphaera sp. DSM 44207 TaxID=1881057 RepID=UPI000891194F|nr:DUF72 domain-containing protein [Quadrisphaera sp. DSM 44207]SDQ49930.1 Uncharacterized conserved protein YecE, DUF72 family [Quadrisphaera sp. DSM 44207]
MVEEPEGPRPGRVLVGLSGWAYAGWRGAFYPRGLPQRSELPFVAQRLGAVEVNASCYRLQRPETYRAWAQQVPDGFALAVKGSRYITHLKRLGGAEAALANFLASGVLALGPKLGPLLWQLPPTLTWEPGGDRERVEAFLAALPRTTAQAAVVAQGHDERLEGRAHTTTDADRPLRHAVEVRHDSFADPSFEEVLAEHGTALVLADTAGRWPALRARTADFAYLRLHGDEELYVSGYSQEALRRWADVVREEAATGRDVLVFFDNDVEVRAPYDAMALQALVGGRPGPAA